MSNCLLFSSQNQQLERLEAEPEGDAEGSACPAGSKSDSTSDGEATKANSNMSRFRDDEVERIVKELRKVKRQNLITHCLLSVMIVITLAWQISEVSIILKLKDGVSHPFRSIGGILKGMLRAPKANGNEEETESSITRNLIESSPVHDLKIPEIELPKMNLGFEDDD